MGGYVMAQVAAADQRIQAVALVAAPPDYAELVHWQNRKWGFLSELPADWALHRAPAPLRDLQPVQVLQRLAPRPVLIVTGGIDYTVPRFMEQELYTAARQPKSILVVPGANHNDYVERGSREYAHRLIDFFSQSLSVAH
jgi:fermentation-respiration switch protein FrsA (DUF1100 family)